MWGQWWVSSVVGVCDGMHTRTKSKSPARAGKTCQQVAGGGRGGGGGHCQKNTQHAPVGDITPRRRGQQAPAPVWDGCDAHGLAPPCGISLKGRALRSRPCWCGDRPACPPTCISPRTGWAPPFSWRRPPTRSWSRGTRPISGPPRPPPLCVCVVLVGGAWFRTERNRNGTNDARGRDPRNGTCLRRGSSGGGGSIHHTDSGSTRRPEAGPGHPKAWLSLWGCVWPARPLAFTPNPT